MLKENAGSPLIEQFPLMIGNKKCEDFRPRTFNAFNHLLYQCR